MASWTCPSCERRFARVGQSHECAPAMTIEEYFATGPAFERPIFEAVHAYLETLGPMTVEPVSVGIFIKADGSFVELRPMTRWVRLSFPLRRRLDHPRLSRQPIETATRVFHFVNLRSPDDLDDTVQAWLAEAYQTLT